MTEVLRYGLICKEDLSIGTGNLEVRLGDGRVVTLTQIRLTDFLSLLTTGSVLFVKAGGVAGEDNANLFWDDTNNRLGIGTASPSTPLHVTGNVTIGGTVQPTTGFFLIQTTVSTGAAIGDVILKNGAAYRILNAAATTSANYGILTNASDDLEIQVPTAAGIIAFRWAGNSRIRIKEENIGAGIQFMGESSADHSAPSANQAVIYTKDNGAGKTQLAVRFATGAVQILATEP